MRPQDIDRLRAICDSLGDSFVAGYMGIDSGVIYAALSKRSRTPDKLSIGRLANLRCLLLALGDELERIAKTRGHTGVFMAPEDRRGRPMSELVCKQCGILFSVPTSNAHDFVFCGRECRKIGNGKVGNMGLITGELRAAILREMEERCRITDPAEMEALRGPDEWLFEDEVVAA